MSRGRLLWADAAKGVAVVAVVFHHFQIKHLAQTGWPVHDTVLKALEASTMALLPIRMPLFFLLSGFFAAAAIRRSWRNLLSQKSALFYYLYLLWLAIQTIIMQATPEFSTDVADGPLSFLAQATIDPSNLWYLYALALYFPLAKLGARSPRVSLVIALALSLVSLSGVFPEGSNFASVPRNLLWFLIGCYCGPMVRGLAERAGLRVLLVFGAAFVIPTVGLAVLGSKEPFLFTVASAAGAGFGVVIMSLAARLVEPVGRVLAYVGTKTLSVYVLHLPLVALWHTWTTRTGFGSSLSNPILAILYPVVMTGLITAITLLLHRGLAPMAPALFERPRFLRWEREELPTQKQLSEGGQSPKPKTP